MNNYHMVLPFVVAIIKDFKGKVLIGQMPNLPRKPYPLFWDLPGGKLEENESPEQCICRELKEELGVSVVNTHLLGVFHHSGDKIRLDCTSDLPGLGLCYEVEVSGEIVATEQSNVHFADIEELKGVQDKMTPWAVYFLSSVN